MKKSKAILFSTLIFLILLGNYKVPSSEAEISSSKNKTPVVLAIHDEMLLLREKVLLLSRKKNSGTFKNTLDLWEKISPQFIKLCDSMQTLASRLDYFPSDSAELVAKRVNNTREDIYSKFHTLDSLFKDMDKSFKDNGKWKDKDLKKVSFLLKKWSITRHKAMDPDHLPVSRVSFKKPSKTVYSKKPTTNAIPSRIPQEVKDLAFELGKNRDSIREWVYKNISFQPYFGVLKGATGSLRDRSANNADTACLIHSLLKASGFEVKYVSGIISYSDVAKHTKFSTELLGESGLINDKDGLYSIWVQVKSGNKWLNFLPSSEGKVVKTFWKADELPSKFKYTANISLSYPSGTVTVAKNLAAYSLADAPAIVAFKPENKKERSILAAIYAMNSGIIRKLVSLPFGKSLTLPSFLVNVSPELKIGKNIFSLPISMRMGTPTVLHISIALDNTSIGECSHMIAAGGYANIHLDFADKVKLKASNKKAGLEFTAFNGEKVFEKTFPLTENSINDIRETSEDYSQKNLSLTRSNLSTYEKGIYFSPFFSENAVSVSFKHLDVFNIPFFMVQSGVSIDVQKDAFFATPKAGTSKALVSTFVREKGGFGNMAEHLILSRFSKKELPVSAFRIINRLSRKGIPILTLTQKTKEGVLNSIPIEGSIKRDIENALHKGAKVIIPARGISLWKGLGYIVRKGDSNGYFLSGGKAGGMVDTLQGAMQGASESVQGVNSSGAVESTANALNLGGNINLGTTVLVNPQIPFPGGGFGVLLAVILLVVLLVLVLA